MQKKKKGIYNLVLVSFLGLLLLFGLFISSRDLLLVLTGSKTEGTVIEATCYSGLCRVQSVRVSYRDSSSNEYIISEKVQRGTIFYKTGQSTPVYYDQNRAIIFNPISIAWPFFILAIVFGVIIVVRVNSKSKIPSK